MPYHPPLFSRALTSLKMLLFIYWFAYLVCSSYEVSEWWSPVCGHGSGCIAQCSSWPSTSLCDFGQTAKSLESLFSCIKMGITPALHVIVGYPGSPTAALMNLSLAASCQEYGQLTTTSSSETDGLVQGHTPPGGI